MGTAIALQYIFQRRILLLPLLPFLVPGLALAQETEAAVARLMGMPASALDPSLPAEPFEAWFRSVLPRGAALAYELNDCGEQAGNPEMDRGRRFPACLAIDANIVSRNRALQLLFDWESLNFRGGVLSSPELEGVLDFRALADLPARLRKPLRPFPIRCPAGTALKLREKHAGVLEWCEDGQGRKQGPYRSWFHTGLYLMEKGTYKDGNKTGAWTECDRFERCAPQTYPVDPAR